MPSATVKKRFAQSDESQADGEKSCLIFPEGMSRREGVVILSCTEQFLPKMPSLPPISDK